MDVPEMVRCESLFGIHADVMSDPGAKMSTQVPKFENEERASDAVVDPTVTALPADAGELLHASPLLFPAAATTVTPASVMYCTASFTA